MLYLLWALITNRPLLARLFLHHRNHTIFDMIRSCLHSCLTNVHPRSLILSLFALSFFNDFLTCYICGQSVASGEWQVGSRKANKSCCFSYFSTWLHYFFYPSAVQWIVDDSLPWIALTLPLFGLVSCLAAVAESVFNLTVKWTTSASAINNSSAISKAISSSLLISLCASVITSSLLSILFTCTTRQMCLKCVSNQMSHLLIFQVFIAIDLYGALNLRLSLSFVCLFFPIYFSLAIQFICFLFVSISYNWLGHSLFFIINCGPHQVVCSSAFQQPNGKLPVVHFTLYHPYFRPLLFYLENTLQISLEFLRAIISFHIKLNR